MTTKARTGIEGGESEGLGLGCLNHLPQVDMHAVAQDGKFVDESDIDIAISVLEYLGHLCHCGGRSAEHTVLKNCLVHG